MKPKRRDMLAELIVLFAINWIASREYREWYNSWNDEPLPKRQR